MTTKNLLREVFKGGAFDWMAYTLVVIIALTIIPYGPYFINHIPPPDNWLGAFIWLIITILAFALIYLFFKSLLKFIKNITSLARAKPVRK